MKAFKIILIYLCMILISFYISSGAIYVKDANSCPNNYQSQNCLGGLLSCGYTSSTLYCANPTTTNAAIPSSNGTSATTVYNSSLGGGYVLDCVKDDTTCIPWICQANSSCYSTPQFRQTTCLAGTTDFVCGACRSGYQNCTGPLDDGCTIQTGVTAQDTNHTVYATSCGYACASGYQNCSGQSPSVDGCNFQTGVTTCDAGGGAPGVIGASCSCTALPKAPFYTNNLTVGYGDQLLWGLQNSPSGMLANLTNNVTGNSFLVNGSGCIKYGVSDWSCNASSGGGTSYDQDLNTFDNVSFNELNVSTNVNLENNFWIKFKNSLGVLTNVLSFDTSDDILIGDAVTVDLASGDLTADGRITGSSYVVQSKKTLNTSTTADFRENVGGYYLTGTNKGGYFGTIKLGSSVDDDISSYRSFGATWTTGQAISLDGYFRMADNGRIQSAYYQSLGSPVNKISRDFGTTWADMSVSGFVDVSSDGMTWCNVGYADGKLYYSVNGATTFVDSGVTVSGGACSVSPDGSIISIYGGNNVIAYYADNYDFTSWSNFTMNYTYTYFMRFSADNSRVLYGSGNTEKFMFLSTTGISGTFSPVGLYRAWYDADISDDGSSIVAAAYTNILNGGLFRSDNITSYNSTTQWRSLLGGYAASFNGVSCNYNNRICVASANSDYLYMTTDGYDSYSQVQSSRSWSNFAVQMNSIGTYMCAAANSANIFCSRNELNHFDNMLYGTSLNMTGTVYSTGLSIPTGTVSLPNGQIGNAELQYSSATLTTTNPITGGGTLTLGSSLTIALNTSGNYTMNRLNVTSIGYVNGSQICTAANGVCPTGTGSVIKLYNSTGASQNTTAFNITGSGVTSSFVDANNVSQIVISGGGSDGTGGWTNTSINTTTSLRVYVDNNLTASNFFGLLNWSYLLNIPSYVRDYSADISAINSTANIMSLGFTNSTQLITNLSQRTLPGSCAAGTVVQNTTTSGVQCVTVSSSGSDGTGGWTNTSTTTSTALNVNVTGNITTSSCSFVGPFKTCYNGTHKIDYHADGTTPAFITN